ncbi:MULTISPECIES: hypothetical protein [unclassified Virgibacillus]|uniref:hypothetical protein n=1 Tax=unclassified Virgibacillus TaxID=2620237 RepID=UPI00090B5019|nr:MULTISPECIES: hypothetical protein [unclassified Virgibacillus]API92691.1 hypothetical protein BKP57_13280 [Virgibacillus sp. 6R]MBS7428186.1 hypothetical protein [Virgibacillus sp. 19R1-5]
MNDKERLESIKEDVEIGIKVWGISIDDIKWLVEQAEELHGTKGRYGYKGMWALCNRDYGRLNAENERYKHFIEKALEELDWGDPSNAIQKAKLILAVALKGESE